jgi:4-hydroxybenzoate polyprenyltransferase
MLDRIQRYLSLIKFSHTIFALPFALVGFVLGLTKFESLPFVYAPWGLLTQLEKVKIFFYHRYLVFILVLLCMVFARSAAMAFNRYLDRHIDAINPRTKIREIPAGKISEGKALAFTITSAVLFVACTWLINELCFYLSFVALMVILGYSYTKRFTPLCHLVLGLGLSLAPIGAYLAVTGKFSWLPILFSLLVLFWVSGFDIIYSLQDEEFDKSQELFSIPSWLGKKNALLVSRVLHFCCVVLLLIIGLTGGFGILYWIGAAIFCLLLLLQHRLVKPNDLSKVNLAFMTSNGIASVVFALFVIADLILQLYK